MSVSNRVFHAPHIQTRMIEGISGVRAFFIFMASERGGKSREGGVNACPFFTLITMRDRRAEQEEPKRGVGEDFAWGEKRAYSGRGASHTRRARVCVVSSGISCAGPSRRRYYMYCEI